MYKLKILTLLLLFIVLWSCVGSNATTMEYRSAKTSVRSENNLIKGEELGLKALAMPEHQNDAQVAYFLAIEIYKPKKKWEKMNEMLNLALSINNSKPGN